MNFHEEARKLEMVREDRKWYENEAATEEALRKAYEAGRRSIRTPEMVAVEGLAPDKLYFLMDGRLVCTIVDLYAGDERNYIVPRVPPRDFYRGQAYEEG